MKRKIRYFRGLSPVEKEILYIPVRYIFAVLITIFEILAIIGIVVALCYFVPYFYLAALLTQIACVVQIISSDDNPDYKVPWLFFVLVLPVAGFMLYFIFAPRRLKPKYARRFEDLHRNAYTRDDAGLLQRLGEENPVACNQARMLTNISGAHLFTDTRQTYFPSGEEMHRSLLADLERAEHFIFMEYFIIEGGVFWDSILEILTRKAAAGVDVRVLYDDIGCMCTLPGNYRKQLLSRGIDGRPFARLRGSADREFNNRNHRKITVIDGYIGYSGGINLADEYINVVEKYGHWKDSGIRLEGEGVFEWTKLFLMDYGINVKQYEAPACDCFPAYDCGGEEGYLVPFGDGPLPLYRRRVGKSVIQNMLAAATRYVYITSPYLIIDNEMCQSIENAALRGVDVKIILPHIPDKKLVFEMSRSYYARLMAAGVEIYEYEPGFLHAKGYLVDDEYAMVGSINLDYRSLVHHFENGVWMYRCGAIAHIKADMLDTLSKSIRVSDEVIKPGPLRRFVRALVRIFAPLL